jgi:archaellum biogenesis protein FlaJ (TadC family)
MDDFNDMLKKVKEWEPAYTSLLPSFMWLNLFLSEMPFFLKVEVTES